MSDKYRRAGYSTRSMAGQRRKKAIKIAVIGLFAMVIFMLIIDHASFLRIGGTGILILLVLMKIVSDFIEGQVDKKIKEEKRAIRGARSEEKIEDLLDLLPETFLILHDINCAFGNIDHLVISNAGHIFLVETKAHGGKVSFENGNLLINGRMPEKNFISQILKNTYWLRDLIKSDIGIKVWIIPILVFTNAFVPKIAPIKGIRIVNRKFLLGLINHITKSNNGNSVVWQKKEEILELLQ